MGFLLLLNTISGFDPEILSQERLPLSVNRIVTLHELFASCTVTRVTLDKGRPFFFKNYLCPTQA